MTIRFDYDDQILDIINTINSELIFYKLQIVLKEEELDGYELGEIKRTKDQVSY